MLAKWKEHNTVASSNVSHYTTLPLPVFIKFDCLLLELLSSSKDIGSYWIWLRIHEVLHCYLNIGVPCTTVIIILIILTTVKNKTSPYGHLQFIVSEICVYKHFNTFSRYFCYDHSSYFTLLVCIAFWWAIASFSMHAQFIDLLLHPCMCPG